MSDRSTMSLQTAPPAVSLRNAPAQPFDGAIAAARTCYSPRVVTTSEITDRQRDSIGSLTFDAGHHTVYQHAHFEFGLENISRQFVWSFLHAHPFYNSEQQSQRYVRMDRVQAYIPDDSVFFDAGSRAIYEHAVFRAWSAYRARGALISIVTRPLLDVMTTPIPGTSYLVRAVSRSLTTALRSTVIFAASVELEGVDLSSAPCANAALHAALDNSVCPDWASAMMRAAIGLALPSISSGFAPRCTSCAGFSRSATGPRCTPTRALSGGSSAASIAWYVAA